MFDLNNNCINISKLFWSRLFTFFFELIHTKRNTTKWLYAYQKSFRGASINRKLSGISVLNPKVTILKKINVSFMVDFCFCKYRFTLETF